jgi:hypothetical protein
VRLLRGPLGFALTLFLAGFVAGAFAGCGAGHARSPTTESVAGKTYTARSPACEQNPLDGVHGPDRLKVLKGCVAFQGTVNQAPVKNPDGDVSFEVSPDPGYTNMLNAHNRNEGGLHIEIVPRDQPGCTPGHPVHVGDVPNLGICSGRDITAPALGAHVRIIGPWVLDRNNNWYEIHPVWSITNAGCRVPRVIGRTLRQARAAISKNLCSMGRVSHRRSGKQLKGHVIRQHPSPGSLLRQGARVNLTISLGPRRS